MKIIVQFENFAVFAISLDAKQDFTLGISCFPAGALRIKIGRAFLIDVFGTLQSDPARLLSFPEA